MRKPDIKILNLNENEIIHFMTYRPFFQDSFIVANAYNKNNLSNWIEYIIFLFYNLCKKIFLNSPIYCQVIIYGNFSFMDDYLSIFTASNELFVEIQKKVI